ncbi:hypothetical protein R5R35_002226 [Gryllus longicercus]|uniref:Uncharacterized protein n=1 Tax=Gryllus longicercus TaxID=2509291 RepID=A0AAN9V928_9ORTH
MDDIELFGESIINVVEEELVPEATLFLEVKEDSDDNEEELDPSATLFLQVKDEPLEIQIEEITEDPLAQGEENLPHSSMQEGDEYITELIDNSSLMMTIFCDSRKMTTVKMTPVANNIKSYTLNV